jgi:putative methyltransferase (TIGR04325 family)
MEREIKSNDYDQERLCSFVLEKTIYAAKNIDVCMPLNLTPEKFAGLTYVCGNLDENVKIVDLGGGAGLDYFISLRLFNLTCKWLCVETEAMCNVSHELKSQFTNLDFITVPDLLTMQSLGRFNLYSNSALQYLEDPLSSLIDILRYRPDRLAILRTPFLESGREYIGVQESSIGKNGPSIPEQHVTASKVFNRVRVVKLASLIDYLTGFGYQIDVLRRSEGAFIHKRFAIKNSQREIKTFDVFATRITN